MKRTIIALFVLQFLCTNTYAQKNLIYSRVINIDTSISVNGMFPTSSTITYTVPANKVWKWESWSATTSYTGCNGSVIPKISDRAVNFYAGSPIWITTGKIFKVDVINAEYCPSGGAMTANIFVSIIEYIEE